MLEERISFIKRKKKHEEKIDYVSLLEEKEITKLARLRGQGDQYSQVATNTNKLKVVYKDV